MSINCAAKALEALQELSELFKSGEITEADFDKFRTEMEPYLTITEKIAIEKNIKISNIREYLKLAASNHFAKSKNSDVLKLKDVIRKAIEKLD